MSEKNADTPEITPLRPCAISVKKPSKSLLTRAPVLWSMRRIGWACSSAGEHYVDIVGVTSSILVTPTATLAIVDLFWTRHHWYTELRMTRQEVKDELKQSQGDPIVKSRLRSMQRDRARKRMISSVPRATLIIANPTHYAVALRYVREESDAPVVVAMGKDLVALKIREIAEKNGIPVFEDPPLARSMFAQVSVDSVIPPVFYKAVAELIHRVYAAQPQQRRVT